MKHYIALFFIHCTLILTISGCSNNEKLSGTVVFPDGSPLTKGTIYFTNDTFTSRAHLRPDGTYDVGSLSDGDGLPSGTYKVYISGAVEDGTDGEPVRSLIALEFASLKTTPLSITVPRERMFNITVNKPD